MIKKSQDDSPSFSTFMKIMRSPFSAIVILLTCWISYQYCDKSLAAALHTLAFHASQFTFLFNTSKTIEEFGYSLYYIIGLFLSYLLVKLLYRKKELAQKILFLLLAILIPGILCNLLKILFGRYRPALFLSHKLYGFSFLNFNLHGDNWSFPSGHTTVIMGLVMALSFLKPRYWLLFMSVGSIIALCRIASNAHYLSDTIFGAYLSIILVDWLHNRLFSPFPLHESFIPRKIQHTLPKLAKAMSLRFLKR